jgi:polyisoprenoid-binding protein YceI
MSITESAVRTYEGKEIPAAGTYAIDTSHSTVEFVGRHLMITKVRGRFEDFAGEIKIAEIPEDSSVEVTIQAASVSTAEGRRDEHLRSGDFFDVETYPTLSFRSAGVSHAKGSNWKVDGELTVRGVTRPVTLDVEFDGSTASPWGDQRIGFTASTEIDREDWGLTWNQALETGGVLVGRKVRIELGVQAVRQ